MNLRRGGIVCKAKQSRHSSQQKRQNKSFKAEPMLECTMIAKISQGMWMILVTASERLLVCFGLWKNVWNNMFANCKWKNSATRKDGTTWRHLKNSRKRTPALIAWSWMLRQILNMICSSRSSTLNMVFSSRDACPKFTLLLLVGVSNCWMPLARPLKLICIPKEINGVCFETLNWNPHVWISFQNSSAFFL